MRRAETVLLAYFGYLVVAASVARVPWPRRLATASAALATAGMTLGMAHAPVAPPVRDWYPALGLALGYWLPRALYPGPNRRQEALLARADRWLARWGPLARVHVRPRLRSWLELAYLLAYPMVPAGALVAARAGGTAAGDRYWSVVLCAVFPCYGMLPWVATRTPRALEGVAPRSGMAWINHRVLGLVSHGQNTVPSGHAAAAVAAALALTATSVPMAAAFAVLAIGVTAGSVLGRYHFAADAAAGVAVAIVAWAAAR